MAGEGRRAMTDEVYRAFNEALETLQCLYALAIEPAELQPIDREDTIRAAARHLRRLSYILHQGSYGIESQD